MTQLNMSEYQTRLVDYINEADHAGSFDFHSGAMQTCSLHIVELYINLSRELATEDYTYGTRSELQWAINYLYTNHLNQIQDPDTFADADWLARTSSLDPAERQVTQYIA